MTRALLALALAIAPLSGCVCTQDVPLSACFDLEANDAGGALPESVTGPVVDDDNFLRGGFGTCSSKHAHEITVDRGEAGRVHFGWEHPEADLSVELDGDVLVEQLTTSFELAASFVIHDTNGFAAALNGANFDLALPGVQVERGNWRAAGATMCGTYSHTDTKVTVEGDEPRFVTSGESVPLIVDGVPFTFHAFASSKVEEWHCTDAVDPLSWALVRDAT